MSSVTIILVMQASVAQAKSQLADLLRRVERGEEVVIVRHGQPASRLVAIQRPWPQAVSSKPLSAKAYAGIDVDEPAFESWKKGEDARLE